MKLNKKLLAAALLICVIVFASLLAFKISQKPRFVKLDLLLTGQLKSKLKPCGCSLQDLGGIARRYAYMKSIRKESDLLLDYGGSFNDSNLPGDSLAHDVFFATLTKMFNYDVMNTSDFEAKRLVEAKFPLSELPLVSLTSAAPGVSSLRLVKKGEVSVAVLGIGGESVFPNAQLVEKLDAVAPDTLGIVLSTHSLTENIQFVEKYRDRPLLVIGSDTIMPNYFSKQYENSLYVVGGDRGRYVTRLQLELEFRGRRLHALKELSREFTPINVSDEGREGASEVLTLIKDWEKKNGAVLE